MVHPNVFLIREKKYDYMLSVKTNKFNKDLTEETLEIIKQAEKNEQETILDTQIK